MRWEPKSPHLLSLDSGTNFGSLSRDVIFVSNSLFYLVEVA